VPGLVKRQNSIRLQQDPPACEGPKVRNLNEKDEMVENILMPVAEYRLRQPQDSE
jgi:hypothetical protein